MSWFQRARARITGQKPKDLVDKEGLKHAGITVAMLSDRDARLIYKEEFEDERGQHGGLMNPDPLVNNEAVPSGTAYDSPRFGEAYGGWRGLDSITGKVLDIIDVKAGGDSVKKAMLMIEYAPILREIYQDGLRVEALAWKEKHDPASEAYAIQTTPPVSPYGSQVIPTQTMAKKTEPPEKKNYPEKLPEGV